MKFIRDTSKDQKVRDGSGQVGMIRFHHMDMEKSGYHGQVESFVVAIPTHNKGCEVKVQGVGLLWPGHYDLSNPSPSSFVHSSLEIHLLFPSP